MNEKINVIFTDGRQIQADLICFLENLSNNKKYLYYTLNETVGNGTSSTVKIYVANKKQENPSLDTPISEDEWTTLKGFMGDALKGNANPNIKYLPLSELGNDVPVVSEKAIAMPTSYDYINKQRGIYATAIASSDSSTNSTPQGTAMGPISAGPLETVTTPSATPTSTGAPTPEPISVESTPAMPTVEPAPTPVTNTPEPVVAPVNPEPIKVTPTTPSNLNESTKSEADNASEETGGSELKLQPIDIATIENKYAEMIATIEKLKGQEIEAAKRYNATIELQEMHNIQHASYVQSEGTSSQTLKPTNPIIQEPTPSPVSNPVPVTGSPITANPATSNDSISKPIEPTIVQTTPLEPTPAVTEAQLETNWFDMPAQ